MATDSTPAANYFNADAKALAKAVEKGDYLAAEVLADFVIENRRHPGFDIRRYLDACEDVIREHARTIAVGVKRNTDPYNDDAILTAGDVNKLYALRFQLEREAKHYGRCL